MLKALAVTGGLQTARTPAPLPGAGGGADPAGCFQAVPKSNLPPRCAFPFLASYVLSELLLPSRHILCLERSLEQVCFSLSVAH